MLKKNLFRLIYSFFFYHLHYISCLNVSTAPTLHNMKPHCNIFYMIVLWCIEVNLFLSAWLLYLYAPAGFTKGEALNTVPADNRQRHRSLATGGPHRGGLIPTDWTRVLYHGATHRCVGVGRRERTDRQTRREGQKHRNWVGETQACSGRQSVRGCEEYVVTTTEEEQNQIKSCSVSVRRGRLAHLRAALSIYRPSEVWQCQGEKKQNRTTQWSRCLEDRLGRQL